MLHALGLTYPQYLVLLVLWEEEAITVRRLGQRLHLDSGTLSPLLKRLEAAGYLHRNRSPTDERSVEVTLTDAGRELESKARCIPEQLFTATGLNPDEAEALRNAVQLLTVALRESGNSADS